MSDEDYKQWKGLIYKIAKKRLYLLEPYGYDLEDVMQIGSIGLQNGLSTFKEDKGMTLISFLYMRIESEILKEVQYLERDKRKLNKDTVSIYKVITSDDEDLTILDTLKDELTDIYNDVEDKLMEEFILEELSNCLSGKEFDVIYNQVFLNWTSDNMVKHQRHNFRNNNDVSLIRRKARNTLLRKSKYFKEAYYRFFVSKYNSKKTDVMAIKHIDFINKIGLIEYDPLGVISE